MVRAAFFLRVVFGAVFSSVLALGASPLRAEVTIHWELENPFRLFQNPAMTRFHQMTLAQLGDEERAAPILSVERRLSQHLPRGWAEDVFDKTCWSRRNAAYSRCSGKGQHYLHPRSHVILASLQEKGGEGHQAGTRETSDDVEAAQYHFCEWLLFSRRKKPKLLKKIKQPCAERAKLSVPFPRGGRLVVKTSDGRRLVQTIKVKDIFIVGIGDSFASGEGNPDVPVRLAADRHVFYGTQSQDYFSKRGYPTRRGRWDKVGDAGFMKEKALWSSQSCHRSLYSHQMRAALQLALNNPQRAVTFAGFACAGAEITEGLFLRFKGNEWSLSPPKFSQISSAARAQCGRFRAGLTQYARAYGVDGRLPILHDLPLYKCARKRARKIDLLMVSIGGNDVKFSSLVANVVVKDVQNLKLIGGWMGHILSARQAKALLPELRVRYKALNRALHYVLHIPWPQADRVLLTGYPNMSFRGDGQRLCEDGAMGMTVAPLFSMQADLAQRAERFADLLNEEMRKAAKRHKWTFVDGHRPAFRPHGLCAVNEAADDPSAETLDLPFWANGKWTPFNPAQYKPYALRKRWFRTPNDAYLTGHLHLSGPVIRNIFKIRGFNRLQVLVAGTYSGAFHPTAEGQAVIADAVAVAAERVLKKYGQ